LKCFEDSAQGRSLHVLEADLASAVYLRMSARRQRVSPQMRQR
jgi:hypothetical protein